MVFWIPVGVVTVLTIIWTLYPLLKREKSVPAARASYDVQVFKDQLKEIDSDEARGVLTAAEAVRIRTEVSRRLLAAAKAEEAEAPAPNAPKTATYGLVGVIVAASVLGGLGLYRSWGAPGQADLPYSENLARQQAAAAAANERPTQAEVEAFLLAQQEELGALPNLEALSQGADSEMMAQLDQLATMMKDRPEDLEGHRILAQNLAAVGRFIEAHAAEDVVLKILGDAATPEDHLEHAELMILAADGFVSTDAISALNITMNTIPENPKARYYAGYALAQLDRPREAYIMWNQLLKEGPEDAPWILSIRASIDDLAARAAADGGTPLAGPSAEQMQDAANMTEAEREDMIRSMIAQLTERLATEGGSVEEWVRLIGANAVLGEAEATAKAAADANTAFADDPAALARINQAAVQAGLQPVALPGPSQQQVEDAADMTDGDRQQMIGSMVERLTLRLADEGGTLDEWLRLISVNGVLGDSEAGAKAAADARIAFANDPAALAQIETAAAALP